jgi:hypothetical protein
MFNMSVEGASIGCNVCYEILGVKREGVSAFICFVFLDTVMISIGSSLIFSDTMNESVTYPSVAPIAYAYNKQQPCFSHSQSLFPWSWDNLRTMVHATDATPEEIQ